MQERKSIPWTALAFLGGLLLFLFACLHKMPWGNGSMAVAKTFVIAILVWFAFTAVLALVVRLIAGRSRLRFETAFAWTFLVVGIADASVWMIGQALRSDLLKSIALELTGPHAARTAEPLSIERPAFALRHPSNWTVEAPEEESEHTALVDTPNGGFFQVIAFDDHADADASFDGMLQEYRGKGTGRRETPFERWGKHSGRGRELRVNYFGGFDATIRLFVAAEEAGAFLTLEFWFDESGSMEKPGFTLIQDSFDWRMPDAPQGR